MASVNKVILVGNCGRDPEVRYLPSGQAVANVSVATSSRRKDKNSGEMIEDTQWHRVTFYDRLAEIAGEYVKKGRPIYVEGRLKYGVYTDKTTGVEKTPWTSLRLSCNSWVAVKAWVAPAVVVKKAAVVTAAQRQHPAQLPQRNALRHLHLPRVALTTWTTTFRSNQITDCP